MTKPSDMTNEELAANIEAIPPFLIQEARNQTDSDDYLREAAKRLRDITELRECLKEAVDERCKKMCTPTALTTKVPILRNFCDNQCQFRKWRTALEKTK